MPIAVTGALAFHIQAVSMSYTPMPIAVTGPGRFNKTEPAALESDKGSDEPDPCAGARLCQQTFPLGEKCASPGGFCFIGRNFL